MSTLISWIAGVRPNEWASMIFGMVSLGISLAAYKASRRSGQHARELEFAGARQEALMLVREIQLGDERIRVQIENNLSLAHKIGMPDLIEDAARIFAVIEGASELLPRMRKLLDESTARARSKHELLVMLRGDVITDLRQTRATQEQHLDFLQRLEGRLATLQEAAKSLEVLRRERAQLESKLTQLTG